MSNTMLEKVHEVEVLDLVDSITLRESRIEMHNAFTIGLWIEQGKELIRLYHEEIIHTPSDFIDMEPTNTEVIKVCGSKALVGKGGPLEGVMKHGKAYRYMAFAYCPWIRGMELKDLLKFDQRQLEKMVLIKNEEDFNLVLELGSYPEYLRLKKIERNNQALLEATKKGFSYDVVNADSSVATITAPDNIKCVITDPPYGMDFVSNRRTETAKDFGILNDKNINIATSLAKDVFENLYKKMNVDSSLFCFIGWKQEHEFMEVIKSCGFEIKNSIIWVKNNHGSGDLTGSFAPQHERIIFAVKGSPKLITREPDVLYGSDTRTAHPTAKPIDLIKTLINATTLPGDLVVDPFAGHGSTLIAAKESNRNLWGCELDEYNYSEIKRWLNE